MRIKTLAREYIARQLKIARQKIVDQVRDDIFPGEERETATDGDIRRCVDEVCDSLIEWLREPVAAKRVRINESPAAEAEELAARVKDTPFSLSCISCDCDGPGSFGDALEQGWKKIRYDDGPTWNFIGVCADCTKEGH